MGVCHQQGKKKEEDLEKNKKQEENTKVGMQKEEENKKVEIEKEEEDNKKVWMEKKEGNKQIRSEKEEENKKVGMQKEVENKKVEIEKEEEDNKKVWMEKEEGNKQIRSEKEEENKKVRMEKEVENKEAVNEQEEENQKLRMEKEEENKKVRMEKEVENKKFRMEKEEENKIMGKEKESQDSKYLLLDILCSFKSSNLQYLETLGEPRQGQVIKSIRKETKDQIARKFFNLSLRDWMIDNAFQEMSILQELSKLNCPYIISQVGQDFYFDSNENISYFVLEMECGSANLQEILDSRKESKTFQKFTHSLYILKMIIQGLKAAKSINITHRDLKPQNIFIIGYQSNKTILQKIGDWGEGKKVPQDIFDIQGSHTIRGTPGFLDPKLWEILIDKKAKGLQNIAVYNPFKADIYSLGLIFQSIISVANLESKEQRAFANYIINWMTAEKEENRCDLNELEEQIKGWEQSMNLITNEESIDFIEFQDNEQEIAYRVQSDKFSQLLMDNPILFIKICMVYCFIGRYFEANDLCKLGISHFEERLNLKKEQVDFLITLYYGRLNSLFSDFYAIDDVIITSKKAIDFITKQRGDLSPEQMQFLSLFICPYGKLFPIKEIFNKTHDDLIKYQKDQQLKISKEKMYWDMECLNRIGEKNFYKNFKEIPIFMEKMTYNQIEEFTFGQQHALFSWKSLSDAISCFESEKFNDGLDHIKKSLDLIKLSQRQNHPRFIPEQSLMGLLLPGIGKQQEAYYYSFLAQNIIKIHKNPLSSKHFIVIIQWLCYMQCSSSFFEIGEQEISLEIKNKLLPQINREWAYEENHDNFKFMSIFLKSSKEGSQKSIEIQEIQLIICEFYLGKFEKVRDSLHKKWLIQEKTSSNDTGIFKQMNCQLWSYLALAQYFLGEKTKMGNLIQSQPISLKQNERISEIFLDIEKLQRNIPIKIYCLNILKTHLNYTELYLKINDLKSANDMLTDCELSWNILKTKKNIIFNPIEIDLINLQAKILLIDGKQKQAQELLESAIDLNKKYFGSKLFFHFFNEIFKFV